jgi:outer membrane protein OmpA-like peptidoglycan-associated protein
LQSDLQKPSLGIFGATELWVVQPAKKSGVRRIMRVYLHSFLLVLASSAGLFVPAAAQAQAAPSVLEMIEQLKALPAAPVAGQRTRSLRNLTVESVPENTVNPPPPSATAETAALPAVVVTPQETAAVATLASGLTKVSPARASLSLLIQFDLNSARVKPQSQQALANLALALQSRELINSRFAIEGHTDAKGRADSNLKLSQQRAEAVRLILEQGGVVQTRLSAVGKGSSELANEANSFAAENRRVRVINLE